MPCPGRTVGRLKGVLPFEVAKFAVINATLKDYWILLDRGVDQTNKELEMCLGEHLVKRLNDRAD